MVIEREVKPMTPSELTYLKLSVKILREHCNKVDDCPSCIFSHKTREFCLLTEPPFEWNDGELFSKEGE